MPTLKQIFSILIGSLLLCTSLTVQADVAPLPPPPDPFKDVHVQDHFFRAVVYLKDSRGVSGYPDGTFRPRNLINRAEFAKIVLNMRTNAAATNEVPSASLPFSDIESNAWYIPFISQAYSEHILSGYPDGTFRPNNNIKFAEAAKIVVLAYGLEYKPSSTGEWYQPYWDTLRFREDNTNLIPESIHSAGQIITRAEMAELLSNISHYKNIYSRTYPIK